jgi:adenosylcobinamide-phosphate synthase
MASPPTSKATSISTRSSPSRASHAGAEMHAFAATLALVLERLFGYPRPLLAAIGHPVIWMGRLIDWLDRRLNRPELSAAERRRRGVAALALLLVATLVPTALVSVLLRPLPYGWVIEGLLATSLLAQKELGRAVRAVADALGRSLAAGRQAVSGIVGRDPEALDEAGVARAAVETLAENASDGVVAPLFWLLVLGLPGAALYKAINTADSMIGHKNERYLDFGRAAARLDDLVNWIPARLTGLGFCAACLLVAGADIRAAWNTMLADAKKHDSPNAGWPEAALAGALGFALGGPRSYDGEVHDLPRLGTGRPDLGPPDIRQALDLYAMLLNVALGVCAGLAVLVMH